MWEWVPRCNTTKGLGSVVIKNSQCIAKLFYFAILYVDLIIQGHRSGCLINLSRLEWSPSSLVQKAATFGHQNLLSFEFNPSLLEASLFMQTYLVCDVYTEWPSILTLTSIVPCEHVLMRPVISGCFCFSTPLINTIHGAGRWRCGQLLFPVSWLRWLLPYMEQGGAGVTWQQDFVLLGVARIT